MAGLKRSSTSSGISNDAVNLFNQSGSKKRRSSLRSSATADSISGTLDLSLSECSCPICFEIFVEPVQTPCKHELCLSCFVQLTEKKKDYSCPMCRSDFSAWAKSASNTRTLVSQALWQKIQLKFPDEIKNRLENKTAQIISDSIRNLKRSGVNDQVCVSSILSSSSTANNPPGSLERPREPPATLARPGEIRDEYLEQLRHEEAKLRAEREREEQLSMELIREIMRQEAATLNLNSIRPAAAPQPAVVFPIASNVNINLPSVVTKVQVATAPVATQSKLTLKIRPTSSAGSSSQIRNDSQTGQNQVRSMNAQSIVSPITLVSNNPAPVATSLNLASNQVNRILIRELPVTTSTPLMVNQTAALRFGSNSALPISAASKLNVPTLAPVNSVVSPPATNAITTAAAVPQARPLPNNLVFQNLNANQSPQPSMSNF
jgi:hypothetical protein